MRISTKSKQSYKLSHLLGGAFICAIVTACAHDAKPVEFYRLSADVGLKQNAKSAVNSKEVIVGLGPIRIPEYLNRPQIMVAISDNQYSISEEHRWAENLDQNILLALYKVLPAQLNTDHVLRYPWSQRQDINYQVSIDILDLTINPQGQSQFIAQWSIKVKEKANIDKRFECSLPASRVDYALMVKVQSQCLTQLGQAISKSLNELMLFNMF